MILSKEELLDGIKSFVGEKTDDDTIKFMENITDTIDDYDKRASPDGVDWKKKYEDNDQEWRNKYTARFFSPPIKDTQTNEEPIPNDEPQLKTKFEELFEIKK